MRLRFEDIKIEDKDIIENIREQSGHILLSHAFCTLFLWKETLKLSIHIEEDFFVVKHELYGENTFFFPCGNDKKKIDFINNNLDSKNFCLKYICKADADFLQANFKDKFNISYDDTGCEYIFNREEHIALSGKKYAKIRYEQNHLLSQYSVTQKPLTAQNSSLATRIIEEWENSHQENAVLFDDYIVAQNALKYFTVMDLIGVIIYLDGEPHAVVVGGEITGDTYSIQIAKTKRPINGLMFYALNECFKAIPPKFTYINGDDDMGVKGIRLHKLQMRPCRINDVWRAEIV